MHGDVLLPEQEARSGKRRDSPTRGAWLTEQGAEAKATRPLVEAGGNACLHNRCTETAVCMMALPS